MIHYLGLFHSLSVFLIWQFQIYPSSVLVFTDSLCVTDKTCHRYPNTYYVSPNFHWTLLLYPLLSHSRLFLTKLILLRSKCSSSYVIPIYVLQSHENEFYICRTQAYSWVQSPSEGFVLISSSETLIAPQAVSLHDVPTQLLVKWVPHLPHHSYNVHICSKFVSWLTKERKRNSVCVISARGSFKMFLESLYFWDIQNSTIIYATFPSKKSPYATTHFCGLLYTGWENFWKPMWKPFQVFRRILNDVGNITEVPSLQCWFRSREQVKISCSQVRRV
jgi:hypothetical protein